MNALWRLHTLGPVSVCKRGKWNTVKVIHAVRKCVTQTDAKQFNASFSLTLPQDTIRWTYKGSNWWVCSLLQLRICVFDILRQHKESAGSLLDFGPFFLTLLLSEFAHGPEKCCSWVLTNTQKVSISLLALHQCYKSWMVSYTEGYLKKNEFNRQFRQLNLRLNVSTGPFFSISNQFI